MRKKVVSGITLVPIDSGVYNAVDHPDHLRGVDAKGKRTSARIYSVWHVDAKGMARCQSWDIWSNLYAENIPVTHLQAYSGPQRTAFHKLPSIARNRRTS
jgi:hypothetical protein